MRSNMYDTSYKTCKLLRFFQAEIQERMNPAEKVKRCATREHNGHIMVHAAPLFCARSRGRPPTRYALARGFARRTSGISSIR